MEVTAVATVFTLFLILLLLAAATAIVLRARNLTSTWHDWQTLAASRGLRASEGDPLLAGPAISEALKRHVTVQRTLDGQLRGEHVAVLVVVGMTGGISQRAARSDMLGTAQVPAGFNIDAARLEAPGDVLIRQHHGLLLVENTPGVRFAVQLPSAEDANRLLEVTASTALAGRTHH